MYNFLILFTVDVHNTSRLWVICSPLGLDYQNRLLADITTQSGLLCHNNIIAQSILALADLEKIMFPAQILLTSGKDTRSKANYMSKRLIHG
jgi:hypothetical protein